MRRPLYRNIDECRVCGSGELKTIHDFGNIPLADKLADLPDEDVPSARLSLVFCPSCCHLQIRENVEPELLFKFHYPYYSSKIPEVAAHFRDSYEAIRRRITIGKTDTILEIAANDGVLLKHFRNDTSNLIAVEPSLDHADILRSEGIDTFPEFFDEDLAVRLRKERKPDRTIILANNVLAHVPDPLSLAKGISHLIGDEGMAVIEVPYSMNMVANCTFDVVIHQHYSYFSLHSLVRLFEQVNLHIDHLDLLKEQGGSFRLFISRRGRSDETVSSMLEKERMAGLFNLSTYHRFSEMIDSSKEALLHLLLRLKEEGMVTIGYGASGKASTMLNYYGINKDLLLCLCDISDSKHYKYFPFTGLQILPVQSLLELKPDFILILAWNYADTIVKSLKDLLNEGSRFIIPFPEVTILK